MTTQEKKEMVNEYSNKEFRGDLREKLKSLIDLDLYTYEDIPTKMYDK